MAYKQFYDVDYDSIKTRLKTFLSNQTILKDYNFEGAAISTWLNFISYVIFYINSIGNFIANELFIANAQLSENIYKSAYQLNYLPRRKVAPKINLSITNSHTSDILIPAYTEFQMGSIAVTTVQDYTIPASSSLTVEAYEGEWTTFEYTFQGNNFETFQLNDKETIDWIHYGLFVNGVKWKHVFEDQNYYLANNYFIRYLDNFEIKFDKADGFFNIPTTGDLITVKYLKTSGDTYNGLTYSTQLIINNTFLNSNYLTVTTTDYLKDGLAEEELESIAYRAPLFYSAAGRCVTENDYNFRIQQMPLYENMCDMIIYSSHKDVVDYFENPVEVLDENSKIDKGFFVYSGFRRVLDSSLVPTYTNITESEKAEVVAYFENYRFMQVFGKYRIPNIFLIEPVINLKLIRDFDVDKEQLELDIHNFMENYVGFNKKINKSDLISFLREYDYVSYCDVDFNTSVLVSKPYSILTMSSIDGFAIGDYVENGLGAGGNIVDIRETTSAFVIERTNNIPFTATNIISNGVATEAYSTVYNDVVIRLFNAINDSTISSTIDGLTLEDSTLNYIYFDGVNIGDVNYDTGYINFADKFTFDTYDFIEVDFTLVDNSEIEVERETALDHKKAVITYL